MQRIEKELDSSFISPASFSIQVAYPLSQATRLRSGCREKCPPLATAAAATTTHTAATNTRSQVKPGTNASARGLRETTLNAGTYVYLTTSVGAPEPRHENSSLSLVTPRCMGSKEAGAQ